MNVFTVLALLLAGAVFLTAVLTSTDNVSALLDPHGALIVLGGSIAATAISFQLDRVFTMLKVFWTRTIRGKKTDYVILIKGMMKIAEAYRTNSSNLEAVVKDTEDPFLHESMEVLRDEILDKKRMTKVLRNRVETMYRRHADDANKFRSMGKYPPAMGLMGAVLGMIALLATLGSPGASKNIGPALSIALVATFYGIALANLLIIPIGENLQECATDIKTKNMIIIEGVRLISEKTNPIVLAEELNSFLMPSERIDWKNL